MLPAISYLRKCVPTSSQLGLQPRSFLALSTKLLAVPHCPTITLPASTQDIAIEYVP